MLDDSRSLARVNRSLSERRSRERFLDERAVATTTGCRARNGLWCRSAVGVAPRFAFHATRHRSKTRGEAARGRETLRVDHERASDERVGDRKKTGTRSGSWRIACAKRNLVSSRKRFAKILLPDRGAHTREQPSTHACTRVLRGLHVSGK